MARRLVSPGRRLPLRFRLLPVRPRRRGTIPAAPPAREPAVRPGSCPVPVLAPAARRLVSPGRRLPLRFRLLPVRPRRRGTIPAAPPACEPAVRPRLCPVPAARGLRSCPCLLVDRPRGRLIPVRAAGSLGSRCWPLVPGPRRRLALVLLAGRLPAARPRGSLIAVPARAPALLILAGPPWFAPSPFPVTPRACGYVAPVAVAPVTIGPAPFRPGPVTAGRVAGSGGMCRRIPGAGLAS